MDVPPGRALPFRVGRRYHVRLDFQALRDVFKAGEILVYPLAPLARANRHRGAAHEVARACRSCHEGGADTAGAQ